jgi:hypothetical protein
MEKAIEQMTALEPPEHPFSAVHPPDFTTPPDVKGLTAIRGRF